jgi:2-iminobutanoate/2-iminopropanoate deaminase
MGLEKFGRAEDGGFVTLAVKANNLVFTTGNIGLDPETGELPPDIETQTRFTLATLQKVLEDAGTTLADVIKVNVYMDEIVDEFDAMSAAYGEYFKAQGISEPPARTTVGARLPWSKVEMDMVALA